jgi:transcriptional regulator with XRE-family HTH domain
VTLTEAVAVNLKKKRTRLKLSQQALAQRAGLSTSYISMLERGERSPPLTTVEILADALVTRPNDLLKAT